MREYAIAAIPADGIGPEVIAAGLEVLQALTQRVGTFRLKVEKFPWGSDYYKKHSTMMPQNGLELLRPFKAIYFGAVGAPDVPDHVTLWGLRLAICQGFDQYVNLRPTRILQGLSSPLRDCKPGDLDWAIVRENTEGEYSGQGGRAHRGFPEEIATETSIFTRRGVTRIMRFAFKLAQQRPRKLLTVVTKSNAQRHGMVLWDEIAAEVANEFPDVAWDKMLVDAMTTRMVGKPASLDTIVATNLHADILSDLAAALAGSLGIAPTANLDPERRFPSMFEPIRRQSNWRAVDRCANVGTSRRKRCGPAIDARRRTRHSLRPSYSRSRRQSHDARSDFCSLRRHPQLERLGGNLSRVEAAYRGSALGKRRN